MIEDPYFAYVAMAYGVTTLILGGLVWASIAANARARKDVERLEKDRSK